MKPIIFVGLCILLVSGNQQKNEVAYITHCIHKQVCLRMQDCPTYVKYVQLIEYWWPTDLKICNREQIGKKLITSVCCPSKLNDKQCGIIGEWPRTLVETRISFGEEASPSEFPWMAMLKNKKGLFFCGGTLITNRFVLTAAHCVSKNQAVSVRLGENTCNGGNKTYSLSPQDIDVHQYFAHPRYNLRQKHNDIAVLQLKKKVSFSESVRPICIPGRGRYELSWIPTQFQVVGRGLTEKNKISDVLKYAEVPVIPLEECENIIYLSNNEIKLDETYVCTAGCKRGNHREGDSGGPLQFQSNQFCHLRYVQHGVVSFGIKGWAKHNNTGVHTRVDQFADWIHSTVHNDNDVNCF